MSDSTTLTRCPHCQTRFRVTEQQLGVAGGKVRCGNCMDVFDAREHAVSAAETAEAAAAAAAPEPAQEDATPAADDTARNRAGSATRTPGPLDDEYAPVTPPEDVEQTPYPGDSDEDEILFQDDPEEDATEAGYARSSSVNDDLSDSFLALDKAGPLPDREDEDPIEEVDESWAEAILEDDSGPERQPRQPAQPARDPEHELGAHRRPQPGLQQTNQQSSQQALQQDRAHAAARPGPDPDRAYSETRARTGPSAPPPAHEMDLRASRDEVRQRPPRTPMDAPEPLTAPPRTPWADLRSSPVSAGRGKRSWGTTLLWGLGCLLLIALIVSQLFWFQFARLSQFAPLRPFYAVTCPWVGCELPVMVDTDQIEVRKLVVRSHPDQPLALMVEASIVNQAPFPQPFPAIVLTFSNLNNDVVAQRAFNPGEYLAGDAAGMDQMGTNTPVRIALELRDPGQDAINYNLRFIPAGSAR